MPKLSAMAPGNMWKKGFFSMGSQHIQLAVAIEADFADSGLAFRYGTAVAAGIAADAVAVDGLPQVALADVARETFGEGAHTGRSRKLWQRKTSNSQPPEA